MVEDFFEDKFGIVSEFTIMPDEVAFLDLASSLDEDGLAEVGLTKSVAVEHVDDWFFLD